jgi:hypothetical protein
MNYNEQTTQYLLEKYSADPTRQTVEALAEELSRSVKSIIGKLSREGVYRREIYKTKTGELPVTKVEIVSNIADDLGLEVESLLGLEKAPKATLKKLENAIKELN